jgi:hypothetical protein
MKVLKILVLSVIVISSAVLYNGCSNSTTNPVTPTTGTVNGKVVDGLGNPISGVTVTIGATSAVTGADGSFTINSVTTPYNAKLVITPLSGTPSGYMYQGLTTFNPQFYGVGLIPTPSTAALTVNFPPLAANQKIALVYTDNALVHASTITSTSPITFNVTWQNSAPITGKLIALVYTGDITGAVVSYDKYGEKSNIALNNNGTSAVTFLASDLNVTPTTSTLTGTITEPAGYTPAATRMILKFTTQGTPLIGVNIGAPAVGPSFSFKVPGGLTSAFTIGLEGTANIIATGEFTLKLLNGTVGGSNNINLETPAILSSPVNAATNVDTTTNFAFAGGTGTGVYLIQISATAPTPKNFYVLTTSTSFTIPSFTANGLPLGSGVAYTWQVAKLGSMASVNDFVSTGVFNNSTFNFEAVSQHWTFTSK